MPAPQAMPFLRSDGNACSALTREVSRDGIGLTLLVKSTRLRVFGRAFRGFGFLVLVGLSSRWTCTTRTPATMIPTIPLTQGCQGEGRRSQATVRAIDGPAIFRRKVVRFFRHQTVKNFRTLFHQFLFRRSVICGETPHALYQSAIPTAS